MRITPNPSETSHKRLRSSTSEDEYGRAADERFDTGRRANRAWGAVMDWFRDSDRAEAYTCFSDLYSGSKKDMDRLESFCLLRELAGENYKDRFSDSASQDGIRIYTIDMDGAGSLRLELSQETSAVLTALFAEPGGANEYDLLKQAFTQTRAVAQRVRDAQDSRCTTLDLSDYPLVLSLPSLPDSLEELTTDSCDLLTALPDLPDSLTDLFLEDCHLLRTVPALPPALQALKLLGGGLLTELPDLPNSLTTLWLDDCHLLKALPALPLEGDFYSLSLSRCHSLTELPTLPESLEELNLTGCSEDLRYPSLRASILMFWNIDGDRIDFRFVSPYQEAWYERAGKSSADIGQLRHSWAEIESAKFYGSFKSLLSRLGEDTLKDHLQPSDVVEVIEEVVESSTDRAMIFEEAQSAEQDCHDRPLRIFNTVQSLARFSRLQRENAPAADIFRLAEGMLKTALLDEATIPLMWKQWEEGRRTGNEGQGNAGPNLLEALEVL